MNDRISPSAWVQALLCGYTQQDRLLRLTTPLGPEVLLAERVEIDEGIAPLAGGLGARCGFEIRLTALSADAGLELARLIGQPVLLQLLTSHSRSELRPFHGHVCEATLLGADGGLARYRLVVRPWLAFLEWRRDSRVFQGLSVIEIIEQVFRAYQGQGRLLPAWRWALADRSVYPRRSLCIQYQETDLAFVQRLMREEGLFCWFEHQGDRGAAPYGGHTLVIADHNGAFEPNRQPRVRYTQPGATLPEDSLFEWAARHGVHTAATRIASWDYRSVGLRPVHEGSALPTALPGAACIDVPGVYAYEDTRQGERLARCQQQALDAAARLHTGRGTVRTFAPGTTFTLADHPRHDGGERDRFVLLRLRHRARNNLAADLRAQLQHLPAVPTRGAALANDSDEPLYGVEIDALPADVPVRAPALDVASGLGLAAVVRRARPKVHGVQTALVVGLPEHPVHTDRDHRIKVQFHWQRGRQGSHRLDHPYGHDHAPASDASGTWVRVMTAVAGRNWGSHFVPRVGQEVLIAFLDGDIDRPVCIGSLYNGQGNHNAQGNRVGGGAAGATGSAPAWFPGTQAAGGLPGHRHGAVMAGIRTQELWTSAHGAGGCNQLVFDDTPGQGRIQLASSTRRSQLNLGHLLHQHDNQRLHPRGHGADLGTDAQGAIRAGSGLFLSAHERPAGSTGTSAQLDAREAEQQLQQAADLTRSLAATARQHGARLPGEGGVDELPVMQAQRALKESLGATATRGHAGDTGDAAGIEGGAGTVKAWSRPELLTSAPAGIGIFTPAHALWSAGRTCSLVAGQDLGLVAQRDRSLVVAKGVAWFTQGQAADPSRPRQETGIRLHAATGSVTVRADADAILLTAQRAVHTSSTHAAIEMAAPRHVLLTAGGSAIRLDGPDITLTTPGAARFKASMKELTGPAGATAKLELPAGTLRGCAMKLAAATKGGAVGVER